MAIILPHGLTPPEIRVLQEMRRLNLENITLDQIKVIKHPAGGGEAPAVSLVSKGFLSADAGSASYTLTERGKEFLAIDARPADDSGSGGGADEADAAAE